MGVAVWLRPLRASVNIHALAPVHRIYTSTYYNESFKAWYVGLITEDLIP